MHFPSVTLLAGSVLLFSSTSLGDSILAIAPITALSGQYALEARHQHIGGSCPAASQTSCADGLGCCPSGAACTYSRNLPVCDELCGAGPKCSNGGCCQAGYFCGVTNNFCTPSPTGIGKMPTFSGPVNAPITTRTATVVTSTSSSEDISSPGGTVTHPTATSASSSEDISSPGGTIGHPTATSTSTKSTRTGGRQGTSGSSHTPSNTAGHSSTTSTKSTSTKTGAAGGGGAVAKTASSRHTPTPSSTGAASSLDAVTALAAMGFGWIAGFIVTL